MIYDNQIRGDGKSRGPQGVEDLAAIGDGSALDKELETKLTELLDLNDEKSKAKYKLEVIFAAERSRMAPYTGVIVAWTNGGFSNGGGDEVIYFCSGVREDNGKTCNSPLDMKFISKQIAVCPECRNAIDPKTLTGQVMAKLTSQNWGVLLTRMFILLDADADIRLGLMPGDLRNASKIEQDQDKQGSLLNHVRNERKWIHYALKDIIKDTSAGSSLYKRIRAFLEA